MGVNEGVTDGVLVGIKVGADVGETVGRLVGDVGIEVVGLAVGDVGKTVGTTVGIALNAQHRVEVGTYVLGQLLAGYSIDGIPPGQDKAQYPTTVVSVGPGPQGRLK